VFRRFLSRLFAVALVTSLVTCGGSQAPSGPIPDSVATGTWGGENAGLLVNADTAHVHIGCTNGYFDAPIELDDEGRFNVPGSYALRVYPVAIGPTVPAQFAGLVRGNVLTLTVAVDDTVMNDLVALGPVTVVFGREPRMQICPICREPGR
jgi:hypothetical protein